MKRSVILSSIIHAAVIAGFFFFSPATPVLEGYPTIYRVGLVSLPAGGRGGAETEGAAEAKASISRQEKKGISVKEVQKTSRKRRRPPNRPQSQATKKEGRVTQGDKLASQYGLGDGISAATVDGAGFGSPYYLSLVFGRIRDTWDNPVQSSAILKVTICFKILRDGQIMDAQLEKTSGIDLFDQSAMRSIVSSAPFPPLPAEYTGEYLGIHLEFEYID